MNIDNLRCFIEVASCGNFTKAAERMYLVQSTVSRRVAKLEEELGRMLVVRDSPTFRLTPEGALLLERGRRVLEELDALERAVRRERSAEFQGAVAVGFYGLLRHMELGFYLRQRMQERYPEIHLNTYYNKIRRLGEDVRGGRPDVVVAPWLELPAAGYVRRVVMRRRVLALVPAGHPLAAREALDLADLRDQPLVFWERATVPGFYDAFMEECRLRSFSPWFVELHSFADSIMMSVATGTGLSVLFDQAQVPVSDAVVQVPMPDLHIPVDVGCAYPEGCAEGRAGVVADCLQWCGEHCFTR